MGLVGLVVRGASLAVPLAPLPLVAGVGGVLGAILTPLTAFSLLRNVALGKALLSTMLGMAIATSVGLVAFGGRILVAAAAGVGGFLVTALLLRLGGGLRKKSPAERAEPTDD